MKKILPLIFFLLAISQWGKAQCSTAYSSATYALAHTKKSFKADNFDHQKYYAERALEAFEKTKEQVTACGCDNALTPIIDGIDNLSQAVDPEDWEAGRFYVQKALDNARDLINEMDICTSAQTSTVNYSLDTSSSSTSTTPVANDGSLLAKQKELEAQQQALIAQQRALEEKIVEQRKLAEQARLKRQMELEEQVKLKRVSEASLTELEKNLKNLALNYGCDAALNTLNGDYMRSDAALESETLAQTRAYYLNKAIKMQEKALEALKSCATSAK
ncbi:hypothetical protein [Robertkochia solimangrovi]|uniref:hypothetical protein n=1 Tax=Robertkochia solimangrovi TaxID=2213046 RepID=UPI00118149A1|nr:hypothetical protein [Robertkochia solimangrovi]TRZ43716.1 hypothetical protein DMZ48_09925 [Robertkochia solimangrovi]